jgi:hypothetical protein
MRMSTSGLPARHIVQPVHAFDGERNVCLSFHHGEVSAGIGDFREIDNVAVVDCRHGDVRPSHLRTGHRACPFWVIWTCRIRTARDFNLSLPQGLEEREATDLREAITWFGRSKRPSPSPRRRRLISVLPWGRSENDEVTATGSGTGSVKVRTSNTVSRCERDALGLCSSTATRHWRSTRGPRWRFEESNHSEPLPTLVRHGATNRLSCVGRPRDHTHRWPTTNCLNLDLRALRIDGGQRFAPPMARSDARTSAMILSWVSAFK